MEDILRTVASSLQTPVVVLLLVLAALMVVALGVLIAEIFTERRHFKVRIPQLVDDLRKNGDTADVIENSGLLRRQRDALLELLRHPDATDDERESMAVNLVFMEQSHFDNRVRVTDLIAKVAPMLGLMGTLIPLGPGLVAIGGGDTATLSESLLMAFDTTVLGLVVACIAILISTIHKSWYSKYMSAFEAAAECVLGLVSERGYDGDGKAADDGDDADGGKAAHAMSGTGLDRDATAAMATLDDEPVAGGGPR